MIDPRDIKVWFPETERGKVDHERSASFLSYCQKKKPKGAFADRRDFTGETLRPWLGNIMVLELDREREDFRYRLYGSEIAARSGFDMTGKWVSDFRSEIGDVFHSQYRKAVHEKRLIVSRNPYLHSRAPCDWERIICPVASGEQVQLVVANHMVELTGQLRELRLARGQVASGRG
ncbi:PAS domain-containing protein [Nisaea sp.]|uniref:PAS domain-containing protein n=1 Tax=Nisaea sp. TaxID=2024842 RepID=UPI003B519A29